MAYYLSKYVGKYRVKADIDLNTNDFPRDEDGKLEQIDVYIKCKKGRIYHYGQSTLVCYCDKLGAGRNVLKDLGKEIGVNIDDYTNSSKEVKIYNYDKFYKALESTKVIWNIRESDEEVEWKFHDKNMELMAKYMKPQTSGAKISPFATSNLPYKKYDIPLDDLTEYKAINDSIDKGDKLLLSRITSDFIANIPKKYKAFKGKDMKALQRLSCLKSKEYIHSIGLWSDYIKYLKTNIEKEKKKHAGN